MANDITMPKKKKEILQIAIDKVQLSDAGVKNKYWSLIQATKSSQKDKVSYPYLYLSTKQAPDLKGLEAGDEITLVVKACVTSHSLHDSVNNKDGKCENFDLDIKQIGIIKK